MRKLNFLLTGILTITINWLNAQPNRNWSVGFGDNPMIWYNYDTGRAVDMDKDGNVYVTGSFYGTMDCDPGTGVTTLTSGGDMDAFVAKYDNKGALVWAFKIGGSAQDIAFDLKIDEVNKVMYVGGYFGSTVDFNPGSGTANLTSAGGQDCFLAKYDIADDVGPLPAYNWAIRMGSGADGDHVKALALDNNGEILVTGIFTGTSTEFNTKSGCTGSIPLTSTGYTDIFVAKYATSGCCYWAHGYGGGYNYDEGLGVAVDIGNNIYFTGSYRGSVDFDPSSSAGNHTSVLAGSVPTDDIFILKLDPTGDYLWSKSLGGTSYDVGNDVEVDKDGNIIITGEYKSASIDFDPGTGTYYVTNSVSSGMHIESYVAKYSGDLGELFWAIGLTSTGQISAYKLALDEVGDIFLTGQYATDGDFDPYGGGYVLSSTSPAFYIAKYSNVFGSVVWAVSAGAGRGYGIDVNCCKRLAVSGDYSGTVDFDFPSCTTANLTSAVNGLGDVFVASYELAPLNSGPGGVGSAVNNPFWFDVNNMPGYVNGTLISSLPDRSGNGNNATQAVTSSEPNYQGGQINGLPALSFSTDDYMTTKAIKCLNTNNISWYTVGKANSNTSVGFFLSSKYASGAAAASNNIWSSLVTTTGNQYASQTRAYSGTGGYVGNGWATGYQMISAIWDGQGAHTLSGYRNGTSYGTATGMDAIPDGHIGTYIGKNSGGTTHSTQYYLNGYIAEIFAYRSSINQTQRVIIDNYLGAKYNLAISDDKYSYEALYGKDVAGIGQAATNDNHLMARGPAIVEIGNPDNLQTNDYMLWGHNGNGMTANIVNVPAAYVAAGGISMNRLWRVTETGTDVGNVAVKFYMQGIDNGSSTNYELLVDADGNLTNATRVTSGYCWDPVNKIASWTGVNFANGDYFTIGCPTGAAFRTKQENLSLQENEGGIVLNVFPNPNTGNFNIALTGGDIQPGDYISIYDALGRLVYEIKDITDNSLTNIQIKDKGLYIIAAGLSGKIQTRKVIIE